MPFFAPQAARAAARVKTYARSSRARAALSRVERRLDRGSCGGTHAPYTDADRRNVALVRSYQRGHAGVGGGDRGGRRVTHSVQHGQH
eukprot:1480497-Prymnesium_polylepis.1